MLSYYITTSFGGVEAKDLGNGIVSWECPSQNASGMTDLPTGWYKVRGDWTDKDWNRWNLFMDEVRDCVLGLD